MRKFASILLFASAATAHTQGYNNSSPGYHSPSQQSNHNSKKLHHVHGLQNGQQHQPWANPQNYSYDAFEPEKWMRAHQLYSSPRVQYIPANLSQPTYGICRTQGLLSLKFGQLPGHPIYIQGTLLRVDGLSNGIVFEFEIQTYGNVEDVGTCPNAGPIFNPFEEVGNQLGDPSIGKISPITFMTAEANEDDEFSWTQEKFFQNLGGENSIIGRAIEMFEVEPLGDKNSLFCCIVARDVPPPADPDAPTFSHYHVHHPNHYQAGQGLSHGHNKGKFAQGSHILHGKNSSYQSHVGHSHNYF